MAKEQPRICFLLAPIGDEGSETRVRSDQVLNHVIKPVAEACGYEALRADQISEPGIITTQVIQHVIDDPMVVADLTDWNPNVFYELAVRHAFRKPAVHIIQTSERIPFDVASARTVQLDYRDMDSVAACKVEIEKQMRAVEQDPALVDNPISVSIDLGSLRQSGKPLERSIAEIISMLQDIRSAIGRTPELTEADIMLGELTIEFSLAAGIASILDKEFKELAGLLPADASPTVERFETLLGQLHVIIARAQSPGSTRKAVLPPLGVGGAVSASGLDIEKELRKAFHRNR